MACTSLPGQMGDIKKSVGLNYGQLNLAAQITMLTQPVVLMNVGKMDTGNPATPPPGCSHMCKVHVTQGTTTNSLEVCTHMKRLPKTGGMCQKPPSRCKPASNEGCGEDRLLEW